MPDPLTQRSAARWLAPASLLADTCSRLRLSPLLLTALLTWVGCNVSSFEPEAHQIALAATPPSDNCFSCHQSLPVHIPYEIEPWEPRCETCHAGGVDTPNDKAHKNNPTEQNSYCRQCHTFAPPATLPVMLSAEGEVTSVE
jgi:hypothetical protein